MRRRVRESPNANQNVVIGKTYLTLGGKRYLAGTTTYNHYTSRGQYNEQELCLDETHPGPPYRSGGPLHVFRWRDGGVDVQGQGSYNSGSAPSLFYTYEGGFLPSWKFQQFASEYNPANLAAEVAEPGTYYTGFTDAESYGATGWHRARPGNPTADLAVFLGEIQDVPRTLFGTATFFKNAWKALEGVYSGRKKFFARQMANQWLNTQFGWFPFVNDLRRFYLTYRDLDKRIAQIKANNGHWQKRRSSIVDEEDSVVVQTSDTVTGHWPGLVTGIYVNPAATGNHKASYKLTTKVWFEGAFRYWIPNIDTPIWRARAIAELFGVFPNPALVWELTPFSWLVDWVSNVGDIVHNMDTGYADNLAAKYAYIMKSVSLNGDFESSCILKDATLHNNWEFPILWKTRAGASKFGFGLTESNFSIRQWSILSALGLSRTRF